MNKVDLHKIAERWHSVVDTTTNLTGYLENTKQAIVGFEDFQEAEEFAKKYGLRITIFFKKDGWNLYVRNSNTITSAMNITAEDYGENYYQYEKGQEENFFEDEVKPKLNNFSDIYELAKFVEYSRDTYYEIGWLSNDEILIMLDGKRYDIIEKDSMSWQHDGKEWIIGVIQDDYEDDL